MKESAQYAYEAYADELNWLDSGFALRPWDALPPEKKDAWRIAVHTAFRKAWYDNARTPEKGMRKVGLHAHCGGNNHRQHG